MKIAESRKAPGQHGTSGSAVQNLPPGTVCESWVERPWRHVQAQGRAPSRLNSVRIERNGSPKRAMFCDGGPLGREGLPSTLTMVMQAELPDITTRGDAGQPPGTGPIHAPPNSVVLKLRG